MTLSEFQTLVRETHKRGSTLDALIPSACAQAARWLEQAITFEEMRQTFQYPAAANDTSISNWPSNLGSGSRIKEILGIKYLDSGTAEWRQLIRVDESEVVSNAVDMPTGYWTRGRFTLYFDCPLKEATTFFLSLGIFSLFPTNPGDTIYLFDHHQDLMLARVMMLLAPAMRDPEMYQVYKALVDDMLPNAFRSEQESQLSGSSNQMHYGKIW